MKEINIIELLTLKEISNPNKLVNEGKVYIDTIKITDQNFLVNFSDDPQELLIKHDVKRTSWQVIKITDMFEDAIQEEIEKTCVSVADYYMHIAQKNKDRYNLSSDGVVFYALLLQNCLKEITPTEY